MTKSLHVKGFTDHELEQIRDAAAGERLTMSAWIRRVLVKRAAAANEQRQQSAAPARAAGGRS